MLSDKIKVAMQDNIAGQANLIYTVLEDTPGEYFTISKETLSSLISTLVSYHNAINELL
jgi:hypothetical protein